MSRFAPAVFAAAVVFSGGSHPPLAEAAGPFDGLLPAVPPQSNTLVLVDVRAAFASPLARTENWAADTSARFRSGVGFVPPDALRLAISSQVNLSAMTRDSQLGQVVVQQLPTMRGLAEREGGVASDLVGQTVALSPRNVYFTTLGPATLAAVYPADRQATARWLRHANAAKGPSLAPYLQAAADAAGKHTVTVAVDLADALDPVLLRMSLPTSPTIAARKGVDIDGLARQLAAARGLTFTADVTDKVAGAIRIDFAFDPTPFRNVLRNLFLELLADQGAVIPGIEAWEPTFGDNAMTLAGPLDGADLRRVLSLFAFPGPAGEDAPATAPEQASAALTRQYLTAVQGILADIRRMQTDKNFDKTATWHDRAALQIDQLNRRGVDPAAVEAAEAAAARLKAIAGSLRGLPIDVEAINRKGYVFAQRTGGWGGGWWGGWGGWGGGTFVQTNLPEINEKIAQTVAADQQRRAELWAQIDQGMSAARNTLGEKFKEKF